MKKSSAALLDIATADLPLVKSIDRTAVTETQDAPTWKPIPDSPQLKAYNSQADELFYGGAGGAGKGGVCHSLRWALENINSFTVDRYRSMIDLVPQSVKDMDTAILMWDGSWKSFAEVQVGDRVMNPDGQVQEILQIYDRGILDTYRVFFEDGTSVECDADHLWGFWEAGTNSRRKTSSGVKPILDTITPVEWNINYITRARVRDTKWLHQEVSKGRRFLIPVCAPLNFTNLHRGNSARAYLYGALIGDGSIQSTRYGRGIRLCSADEWIIERCTSLLEKWFRYDYEGSASDVVFKDKWVDQWARNTGLLGTHCHTKFLPEGYLKESLEFRWALAQGLFDTDGYAAKERNEISYCSVSLELAEGVARLVRSLGFMAQVTQKQGVCYSKGYEGDKRMAYIVNVQGNNKWRLFSLPRKVESSQKNESMHWVGKAIVRIEKSEPNYVRCIKVSNPNSLYVTDGYNVTHNSDLLLGIAGTAQTNSIIFRRIFPSVRALIERSREIYSASQSSHAKDSYNESLHLWRLTSGKTIEFASMQYEKDKEKYRGRPHDYYGWDEITEFTESQFRFVNTWNRTANPNQRCRIVATGNPPTTPEGMWVTEYWSPWLKPDHPNPAAPGELVWFVRIGDQDIEVGRGDTQPDPIEHEGRLIKARSRTFIPGRVEDNPYLMATGYDTMLDSLPEPLRSQMRFGIFGLKLEDVPYQIIPTAWVEAAMARWTEDPPYHYQHAIGVDPARGGKDNTGIAQRCGDWFDVKAYPGKDTPDGASVAQLVVEIMHGTPEINIDVIGIGSSPVDMLGQMNIYAQPLNGSEASKATDRSGKIGFANKRAEWHWKLREALDPDYGSQIALPPDPELKADLCAPRWMLRGWRIAVESKDDIKARLGRSPGKGEAIIYASVEPADAGSWVSDSAVDRSVNSVLSAL